MSGLAMADDNWGVGEAGLPPAEWREPVQRARGRRWRRGLYLAAGLLALGAAAQAGWLYWTEWRFLESTDDAYVQADVVAISAQVNGYLDSVLVEDNQPVKAGDVLATIDPRLYREALEEARGEVAEAEADIERYLAQLSEQQAEIAQAEATLEADRAAEVFASEDNRRYGTLAKEGYGSVQRAEQAKTQNQRATATVGKDEAALDAAKKQVAILEASLKQAQATLVRRKAELDRANTNLDYTILTAPVDGVVGHRELRKGLYVSSGQQLLAVVPLQATYVVANFKETELTDVRPGQSARIEVDSFPDLPISGLVDSLAPASGQQFALLPPDNATGNFTKIVQRIPVRIVFDADNPLAGRLVPGMSVTATIDTRKQP